MIRFDVMQRITSDIPSDLNDVDIYDILSVNWSKFKFDGDEQDYVLTENDIYRPDLLSYNLYGTVNYQNVLFIINNIGDLLNLVKETTIKIPKIQSIKKFFYDNRKNV
jgi:hypothetical protein